MEINWINGVCQWTRKLACVRCAYSLLRKLNAVMMVVAMNCSSTTIQIDWKYLRTNGWRISTKKIIEKCTKFGGRCDVFLDLQKIFSNTKKLSVKHPRSTVYTLHTTKSKKRTNEIMQIFSPFEVESNSNSFWQSSVFLGTRKHSFFEQDLYT